MSDYAQIGRALQQRIGVRDGTRIMAVLAGERRRIELGTREPDAPSRALTEAQHTLLRSDFTPDERARIRIALGIDVLADVGFTPDPDVSEATTPEEGDR